MMNEHKNKEWRVEGCHPVRYVISGGDIWLSQRSISEIFGLSVKTINEHLIGLMKNMGDESCRVFVMTQQEGVREISRPIKHYPLSLVYGVGIKSQRFDKLEELKTLADREGVETKGLVISSNKEYVFGKLLTGVLDGIAEVFPQHFVDPFFIDFYIPAFNLAVEYDDEYHFSDKQREKDGNRQDKIESRTGMKFIRVKEGYEAQGINDVLKTILLARRGELDERAEFEKAWTSYPGRKTPVRFDDGEYQYPAANTAWKFWQARAALAQQDASKVDAEPVGLLLEIRTLGNYGAAYDLPGSRRAYTYDHQPGNIMAYRIGKAFSKAAVTSSGDAIDRGLGLIKELQAQGFGVFEIESTRKEPDQ